MSFDHVPQARITRLLNELSAFSTWQSRPLPRQLKELLSELDEQTLMSLAAASLSRLGESAAYTKQNTH